MILVNSSLFGQETWHRIIGGENQEIFSQWISLPDSGLALIGTTSSNDRDFKAMNKGSFDVFVLKLGSDGAVHWKETFGGSGSDFGHTIVSSFDGGFIISGITSSMDGDFKAARPAKSSLFSNAIFIFRLDKYGRVKWKQLVETGMNDRVQHTTLTPDGGCIVTGSTIPGPEDRYWQGLRKGELDFFIIKLDSVGKIEWKNVLMGSKNDVCETITSTMDGGCILTGVSLEDDYFEKRLRNDKDEIFWIKLDKEGVVQRSELLRGFWSGPAKSTVDGGVVRVGSRYNGHQLIEGQHISFPAYDIYVLKMDKSSNLQATER